MLYGIVTHVDAGIGNISSNNRIYKFSLTDFPEATVGMQVTFDPENISGYSDTWVTGIQNVGISPMANILKRLEVIEELLQVSVLE